MTPEQISHAQKLANNLAQNLTGIIEVAHNAIKEIEKTDPILANQMLQDLNTAREAKDISTINQIMIKYANSSKQ